VVAATGSSSELVFVPYEEVYEAGVAEEMFHRAPAIDKIEATIGWRPEIDLDGILADVIAYTKGPRAPSPT
jgi:UDP-glucose 4-epimerase